MFPFSSLALIIWTPFPSVMLVTLKEHETSFSQNNYDFFFHSIFPSIYHKSTLTWHFPLIKNQLKDT